jgi:hypothetical protein
VAIPRSGERFAEVGGGIELCYQTIGEPERPPVVLMMGIGSQMLRLAGRVPRPARSAGRVRDPVRQP